MNPLSREDIEDGGAIFALLVIGGLAYIVVGTVSELTGLPLWLGAIVCVVGYSILSHIGSGIVRWWESRPAPTDRRAPTPEPPQVATAADRERHIQEKLTRVEPSQTEVRAEYERFLREIDDIRQRHHR